MSQKQESAALHASAATLGPIAKQLILAAENLILGAITDPNAKQILTTVVAYINSLLGINTQSKSSAEYATEMHMAAAQAGPFIQALIAALEKILAGFAGNPAVLQAIIAFIMQLLGQKPVTP